MADNEIVVATRYTTEGFDQALSKADRIGQRMSRLSRDIGGIGRFLNNDFLIGVSNALGGIEDMIGAVSELSKAIRNLPALPAAGIIFGGAALAGEAAGKAYNTATGTVDTSTFVAAAQKLEDALKKIPAEQAAAAMQTFNARMQNATSAQRVAGMNALADSLNGVTNAAPAANDALLQLATRFKAMQDAANSFTVYNRENDLLLKRIESGAQQRIGDAYNGINAKLEAATTYQERLAQASSKYNAAEFDRKIALGKLDAEISQRRIAAAQSLASDLARLDADYYANRLALAQSYGQEAQRAEEDHQRNMRRLQQDHDKRLRKLADSRDALAIEDEIDNYETERQNAEEDYAVMAARRSQDYANQLRDMQDAFNRQRQERINAYNQQLTDIATYNKTQREYILAQFRDIAAAVLQAFTDAARGYTQSTSSTNTTSNTLTQTNNFPQNIDAQAMVNLINTQVASLFRAAR